MRPKRIRVEGEEPEREYGRKEGREKELECHKNKRKG